LTAKPTVYGAPYSVYVRIVLLALLEKGTSFKLEPVDVFAHEGIPDTHLRRHPFGKIPALHHDGFELYETGAITRYIDERFPGPSLMPDTAQGRAKANQIISIVDNYGYPSMVWGVYVPLTEEIGSSPENSGIRQACEQAHKVIDAIDAICSTGSKFLLGDQISLADIYLLPVIHYFQQTQPGRAMIEKNETFNAWWEHNSSRPGVAPVLENSETSTD